MGVGHRGGQRLVDEQAFAGLQHGRGLGQVRPAVDAVQQDHVHLGEQFLDAIDELDPLAAERLGELLDAVGAEGHVGAAALEGRHDLDPQLRMAAEEVGERDGVAVVHPDDAGAKVFGRPRRRRRLGRKRRGSGSRANASDDSHGHLLQKSVKPRSSGRLPNLPLLQVGQPAPRNPATFRNSNYFALALYSYAPMSYAAPCGRAIPSKSAGTSFKALPASMAGLPGRRRASAGPASFGSTKSEWTSPAAFW